MTKKKKELDDLRKWAIRHQQFSELIEHLMFAGWIDQEKMADLIASDIIKNPYGATGKSREEFLNPKENKTLKK